MAPRVMAHLLEDPLRGCRCLHHAVTDTHCETALYGYPSIWLQASSQALAAERLHVGWDGFGSYRI